MMEAEQYDPWLTGCLGYWSHMLKAYNNSAVWKSDPKLALFQGATENQFWPGYKDPSPTPPGRSRRSTSWCRCAPPWLPASNAGGGGQGGRPAHQALLPRMNGNGRGPFPAAAFDKRGIAVTATTIPRWAPVRTEANWLVRLFDWKPFLVFICMLPAAGLLLTFLTYPLGPRHLAGVHRHHHWTSGQWVGLENFEFLFGDRLFWQAVFYSVFYTSVATVGKFGLGLWLALLPNNRLPFKSILRAIILLPDRADSARRSPSGGSTTRSSPSSPTCSSTSSACATSTSISSAAPGRRAGR